MLRQQQLQAGNKLLYSTVLIYTAMLVHHLIYDLKELGLVVRSARHQHSVCCTCYINDALGVNLLKVLM